MTDVIKQWIVKKLGLPVSFSRGPVRVRKELSNGRLIGEVLRKYHLISDDMLITLADSVCYPARMKNMKILHHWLDNQTSFEVDFNDLIDISEGKPGAAIAFLYRMYLWLEGPGSEPGLHPRTAPEKSAPPTPDEEDANEFWTKKAMERFHEKDFPHIEKPRKRKVEFVKGVEEHLEPGKTSSLIVHYDYIDALLKDEASDVDHFFDNEEGLLKASKSDTTSETKLFKDLQKSLGSSNVVAKVTSPKLNVTPSSAESPQKKQSNVGLAMTCKPSAAEEELDPVMQVDQFKDRTKHGHIVFSPEAHSPHLKELGVSQDYIEVDEKELFGHECGRMPVFYHRNMPFGNLHEQAQAGELYFHTRAVLLMEEQQKALEREYAHVTSDFTSEKHEYLGVYEAVEKARQERIEKRIAASKDGMMSDISNFDKMISQKPPNAEEPEIEIYAHGRGNCVKASERIEALKSRRRKEKIYFEKRCQTRKMMAASYVKSISCDMLQELEKTIHDKLIQKSKPESSLANYYSRSHLEKTAFLDHVKVEEEQLLSMKMNQLANEVIHSEQLDEVEKKVNNLMEANKIQIKNANLMLHRRAQLIRSIKFCEEMFILIVKIAVRFSQYRSENGCDPPKELVAEWNESLYLGNCATSLPVQGGSDADNEQLKKDEKLKDEDECYPNELGTVKSKTKLRFIKLKHGKKLSFHTGESYTNAFEETGEQEELVGEEESVEEQIEIEEEEESNEESTGKKKSAKSKKKSGQPNGSTDSVKSKKNLSTKKKSSNPEDKVATIAKIKSKMRNRAIGNRSITDKDLTASKIQEAEETTKNKTEDKRKRRNTKSLNETKSDPTQKIEETSEENAVNKGKNKGRKSIVKAAKIAPSKSFKEDDLKADDGENTEMPDATSVNETQSKIKGKNPKGKNAAKQKIPKPKNPKK